MGRLQSISLVLLSLSMTLSVQQAVAGSKDAGAVVDDSVYMDNVFGFSFTKPATWKFDKVYSRDDIERVVLIMKNPTVLPQFADYRDYFTQPQVTVLAASIDKTAKEYKDLIFDPKYKDKLKSKAEKKFVMLQTESKYSFEPQRDRSVKVGGRHGVRIDGRKQYYWAFEGEVILSDYMSGRIYALETESGIVLIECVAERELIRELDSDFDRMIESFVFLKSGAEPPKADTATVRTESKNAGQ